VSYQPVSGQLELGADDLYLLLRALERARPEASGLRSFAERLHRRLGLPARPGLSVSDLAGASEIAAASLSPAALAAMVVRSDDELRLAIAALEAAGGEGEAELAGRLAAALV
jgi:hypothetical protein